MKRNRLREWIRFGVGGLLLFSVVGCARLERKLADTPSPIRYQPTNIFAVRDLEGVVNVAVLPVHMAGHDSRTVANVQEIFRGQLRQSGRFDLTEIDGEELRRRHGFSSFAVQAPFPEAVLADLRSRPNVDAVLVTEITHYRPYRPIAIGVRARLFDVDTLSVLWECDEVFDSGSPAVAAAARAHSGDHSHLEFPLDNSTTVLHSPTRFSKYVAGSLYATLPPRRAVSSPTTSSSFGGGR